MKSETLGMIPRMEPSVAMRSLVALCVVVACAALPVTAAAITVTSTSDTQANDGVCTLREAIIAANTNTASGAAAGECIPGNAYPTADLIHFNISGAGPHIINTTTGMPPLGEGATIDGRTQPGYTYPGPRVFVNFTGGAGDYAGIVLGATGCEVHALGVTNFPAEGILISATEGACFVTECYLGLAADGTTAAGNKYGVRISNSPGNLIGSQFANHANWISGNGNAAGNLGAGVEIYNVTSTGNVVLRNYIGTNRAGTAAVGNQVGIAINSGASGNFVGLGPYADNIIAGNVTHGISIVGSNDNYLYGNHIGTNAAGTAAIPNGANGIHLDGSDGNEVGSTAGAGLGNLISGNGSDGVWMGGGSSGNRLKANVIGTSWSGIGGLGNQGHGVFLGSSPDNWIGGTEPGAANVIAFNGADGVAVVGVPPYCILKSVLSNSIHSNGGLGIDLGDNGVTPNDPGDPDTGPNNLQNFPDLTEVVADGGNVTISGSLNSSAGTYTIQFFSSPACDPSGYGEGAVWIGDTTVLVSETVASFAATLPAAVPPGHVVTAAATDAAGNTSEFSACITLAMAEPIPVLSLGGLAALAVLIAAAAARALRARLG